jgi:hypothetical protein
MADPTGKKKTARQSVLLRTVALGGDLPSCCGFISVDRTVAALTGGKQHAYVTVGSVHFGIAVRRRADRRSVKRTCIRRTGVQRTAIYDVRIDRIRVVRRPWSGCRSRSRDFPNAEDGVTRDALKRYE